jgi:hypothetical protein
VLVFHSSSSASVEVTTPVMLYSQVFCGVGCVVGCVIPDVANDRRVDHLQKFQTCQDGVLRCLTQKMTVQDIHPTTQRYPPQDMNQRPSVK